MLCGTGTPGAKKRVLFFAECVTLAHFGRMVALAETLDPELYDIGFAAAACYDHLLPKNNWHRYTIYSIEQNTFQQALAHGQFPYSFGLIVRYIAEDLAVLDAFKPDLIVGDFRLSLNISARFKRIPFCNMINAYWDPAAPKTFTVPELVPWTRFIPTCVMQFIFTLFRPIIFSGITRRFNKLRRAYSMAPYPPNLVSIYADGDITLYDDIPVLAPIEHPRITSHYLGPISWSVNRPLPTWWTTLPKDRPIILVSLGSSGDPRALKVIIEALSQRTETVVITTAGHALPCAVPDHMHVVDYISLKDAVRDCAVMISNGGISGYIALAASVPVLGLPRNLDQFLCSQCIAKVEAGLNLRCDTLKAKDINHALDRILGEVSFKASAKRCAELLAAYDYRKLFPAIVDQFLNK